VTASFQGPQNAVNAAQGWLPAVVWMQ
jgi:hypothetical protein